MLNFPDVVNRKLLPVFLFPFGTAKVETFFTFSKFIFTYFLSDPFRRFPAFFNAFTPSFAGCKGVDYFNHCQVLFSLFFDLIFPTLNVKKQPPFF